MMQISDQKTQVMHEFERLREREITAVENVRPRVDSAIHNEQTQSQIVDEEAYRVTLSPAQEVQKKSIESISGREITFYNVQQQLANSYANELNTTFVLSQINSQAIQIDGQLVTESSVLTVRESLYEYERMDFNTTFSLSDAQGDTSFHQFSLSYERELDIKRQLTMSAVEFTDPLVLNIGQKAELFSKDKHAFDLDSDGHKELIPELASGIWYLVFDRNQNGIIDNGLELFGAQSGQGFAELTEFDNNGNGLVEENDERFKELKLWDGQHSLQRLAEGGIRAISLNAVDTPFTFIDSVGNPTSQIRQTSIFVTDTNRLGAVHQVDIAV